MNKKTFIGFVVGIPLLVLILIIIILVGEPEPEGISRGVAYKSAALLLTDRESCEKMLSDHSKEYFPEKEQNNWYVKYMNYLYAGGYLDQREIPAKRDTAEGFLTYREAENLAEALVPGSGKKIHESGKKQNRRIPSDEWWYLYEELRGALDKEGKIKVLDVFLYGTPTNVKTASAWTAYTSGGDFQFEGISLDSYIDWELKLLVKGNVT
ncbi:MAG TPA: stage II sporulation protein SpoIID, partial [Lachnoclostridium sp.]|nr:stage II sporulation protein SpoIID [Lachnoclostridium sp.]